MPELPEVETTRRGIEPWLTGQLIESLSVREPRLRWPVAPGLAAVLCGRRITAVERRGKYLLLRLGEGALIIHLGMSGSLRIHPGSAPVPGRHDHIDIGFESCILRFNDPRRFGSLLYCEHSPELHPLLIKLGPEPLGEQFSGDYLYQLSRGRYLAVKNFIMNSAIVVGVGNIYANEALFAAGIRPARAAGRVALGRYRRLADSVREVLGDAIAAGGTTLRDFVNSDGRPGYFRQTLKVYGRGGETCLHCETALVSTRTGQRATVFCPHCQR